VVRRPPLLFVIDGVDRLSERQIKDIFEVAQHVARSGAAAVLIAAPCFLARMEHQSLQFLKDGFAAQLRFQEVCRQEDIDSREQSTLPETPVQSTTSALFTGPKEFKPGPTALEPTRPPLRDVAKAAKPEPMEEAATHAEAEPASETSDSLNLLVNTDANSERMPASTGTGNGPVPNRKQSGKVFNVKVVRSLAASVILLTTGFGAFLFLQHIKPFTDVSVRFAPGNRPPMHDSEPPSSISGMTAEAEPTPPVSSMPPDAVERQPVLVPEPRVSGEAAAPAKDPAALQASSDAATPAPLEAEPAPEVTSPAPKQDQAPSTSTLLVPRPPPIQAQPGPQLSPQYIAALLSRGDGFLSAGDIASARLFYERAAQAGDGSAALRLGATFDPGVIGKAFAGGVTSDPLQAAFWYRQARDFGNTAAAGRLKVLEQQNPAESNPRTP
jgi:hypothetical protein